MKHSRLLFLVLFLVLAIQPIIYNALADNDLDYTTWGATLIKYDSETGETLGILCGVIVFGEGVVSFTTDDFNILLVDYSSTLLRGIITWNAELLFGKVGPRGNHMVGQVNSDDGVRYSFVAKRVENPV